MARSLWMGDLQPYMDEEFIKKAFYNISQPTSVKIIRRKDNPLPAGYCFVEFATEAEAERVLKLVNATSIPGTNPPKRFRLNRSQAGKNWDVGPSYSIFVGDLDHTVTDDKLEDFFSKRYRSVKGAKIMYEDGGVSRGYGFVRFSDEYEYKKAMVEMQGARGLGSKQLRVSMATPKDKLNAKSDDSTTASVSQQLVQQLTGQYQLYQQYYNNYYNNFPQQLAQQQHQYNNYYHQLQHQIQRQQQQQHPAANNPSDHQQMLPTTATGDPYQNVRLQQEKLEDPNPEMDVDAENEVYFAQRSILLDRVLGSHWQPLDSLTSRLTVKSSTQPAQESTT